MGEVVFYQTVAPTYRDNIDTIKFKVKWLIDRYKDIFHNITTTPTFRLEIFEGIIQWKTNIWEPHTKYVFNTEGGDIKWAPNRGWYAVWKRANFANPKILVLGGALRKDYTSPWKFADTGNEIVVSQEITHVGYYHQFGIPPRNWMGTLPFLKRVFHYITPKMIFDAGRRVGRKVFSEIVRQIREYARNEYYWKTHH